MRSAINSKNISKTLAINREATVAPHAGQSNYDERQLEKYPENKTFFTFQARKVSGQKVSGFPTPPR
jgi:hypothetical protein